MSEDVGARYEAYGWHVQDVGEDLSTETLERAATAATDEESRPSLVIVRSHIGFGSPLQDTSKAHGSPLGEDNVRITKENYGWDPDAQFLVPDEVLEHFREAAGTRGGEAEAAWDGRMSALREAEPDVAGEFDNFVAGRMPEGFDADPPRFDAGESMATRKASGAAIQWAAAAVPQLVGGAADLSTSTNTDIDGSGDVEAGAYGGRNLRFGVREHGMGAIVNGLTAHGFRGYGSTFLIFSDYMKGAIRLSALQKLPAIWVYTHDSIGLGEDGPTHQPVEQLAGLRAIPRLAVLRPADANETALGWRYALRQTEAPTAFALSRQDLPILDPASVPDDAVERGAYVLRESSSGGDPALILIATGSEVSLAMEAAELLEGDGLATRVVSMPCMDNFSAADQAYRDEVLPPSCRARVAVEAASPFGWDRWTGPEGRFVGMETFGESGPYKDVYEHFGITVEAIAEAGRAVVEHSSAARS